MDVTTTDRAMMSTRLRSSARCSSSVILASSPSLVAVQRGRAVAVEGRIRHGGPQKRFAYLCAARDLRVAIGHRGALS